MAVAYAALANGGDGASRPHVGLTTSRASPAGSLQEIRPGAPAPHRHRPRPPGDTIMTGLHARRDGAGRDLLPGLRQLPVRRSPARPAPRSAPNQPDQSWYIVARSVRRTRRYVVAVTIERGGFGVDTAAPVARPILEQLLPPPITPTALEHGRATGTRRSDGGAIPARPLPCGTDLEAAPLDAHSPGALASASASACAYFDGVAARRRARR